MEPILDDHINENPNNYLPCFNCEETNYSKINYTWWGGVLGPKLFHYVKCNVCGTKYNGKTGQSANTAIAIYMLVLLAALGAVFMIFL